MVFPSREPRDPGPELSEEEKDKRTVFCMQLAQRVTGKDLEEFLGPAGKVSLEPHIVHT